MFLIRLALVLWLLNYVDNYLFKEWPEFREGLYLRIEKAWDDVSRIIDEIEFSLPNKAFRQIARVENLDIKKTEHYLTLLNHRFGDIIVKSVEPSKNFQVYKVERLERF